MTLFLIALICLVYGITSFPTLVETHSIWLELGAFYAPAVKAGQLWRILSGPLMHANLVHLLSNVLGLFIFGRILEPAMGKIQYALLVLLGIALGDLFSAWFLPAPTVGISAVNYAMIGCYISRVLVIRLQTDKVLFYQELRGALGFLAVFVLSGLLAYQQQNLWGHLGGLLAGTLVGAAWPRQVDVSS